MVAAARRGLPLVFVSDVAVPVLSTNDERHLRASLRLGAGTRILVSDGKGSSRVVSLGSLEPVDPEIFFESAATQTISVGFSPVKAQKPEWMVQKLTELGVDRIQPLVSERAVVRLDRKKRVALRDRLTTAAREASMQCKRVWLPTIEEPRSVAEVVALGQRDGFGVVLADPDGDEEVDPATMILVGPEGGWSATESASAPHVLLPGNVLRAETATIVAGAVLDAARGKMRP